MHVKGVRPLMTHILKQLYKFHRVDIKDTVIRQHMSWVSLDKVISEIEDPGTLVAWFQAALAHEGPKKDLWPFVREA